MTAPGIMEKIKTAPASCGVYIFKDARSRILYVGKARNLRNRLRNYLSAERLEFRKQQMIASARDVSFIITDSELEALALEANLIKQNRPPYNIVLRDDKNYPYIRIDLQEEWPRIEVVRRIRRDRALYFGPYIPASGLRQTLSFIRRYFGIRPCRYARLDRTGPCVQYQMGHCPAPCGRLVSREKYLKNVEEVIAFLKGKRKDLVEILRKRMHELSGKQMFEEAAKLRDRIAAIEKIWDSQKVVAPGLGEMDIAGLAVKEKDSAVVVFFIRNGLMTGSREFFLPRTSDIPENELLHSFMEMLYSNQIIPPARIVLPSLPEDTANLSEWLSRKRGSRVAIEVPARGKKRELVQMARRNAEIFLEQYRKPDHGNALEAIKDMLRLPGRPLSIGAFDVSTTGGTASVGAFIFWEGGHFRKELYRFVHIRSVKGTNDYAMMGETLERLLHNLSGTLPDIIIIDGGRGHLETALSAVRRAGLANPPAVAALAKDPDRLFTEGGSVIDISNSMPSSLLLRSIRDEAHRFAVTRHRRARKGRMFTSSLEGIPGIGRKRRLALLRHFGSAERIREASVEEIAAVEGMTRRVAESVKRALEREAGGG